MQGVFELPVDGQSPLEMSGAFFRDYLQSVAQVLADPEVSALAIILPSASPDHDASRRALAQDLAREFTPKRVNIVGGEPGEALDRLVEYLSDALGVTGHYLQTHE